MPKRMSISEFRAAGFLQEANRLFFHPLGLALEIVVEPCGCDEGLVEKGPAGATYSAPCDRCRGDGKIERLGGIWDYRDDPEGILYDAEVLDPEKAATVAEELFKHEGRRRALFDGDLIQPLPE